MNWSSVQVAGMLNAEKPDPSGKIVCGVGYKNWPLGSLALRIASAAGLMFEPSGATATPPKNPLWPPKIAPRAAGERSLVKGGSSTVLAEVDETPFFCRVPW